MEEMTIKEAQAAVDHWIKTYGVAISIVIWAMKWPMFYGC